MRWYFDSDQNFKRLKEEIAGWRGTPFMPCFAMKGVGVDCVRFVERILVGAGAIDPVPFPSYVISGGGAAMLVVLVDHLARVPKLAAVWKRGVNFAPTMKRGDLLLVSTGTKLHHFSILVEEPVIWHCLIRSGVCEGNVHDPIIDRHLLAIYRAKG